MHLSVLSMRQPKELIHFDLGEDFSIETAVVVGELIPSTANGNLTQSEADFRVDLQHSAVIMVLK